MKLKPTLKMVWKLDQREPKKNEHLKLQAKNNGLFMNDGLWVKRRMMCFTFHPTILKWPNHHLPRISGKKRNIVKQLVSLLKAMFLAPLSAFWFAWKFWVFEFPLCGLTSIYGSKGMERTPHLFSLCSFLSKRGK
jgi:hypothetical protein